MPLALEARELAPEERAEARSSEEASEKRHDLRASGERYSSVSASNLPHTEGARFRKWRAGSEGGGRSGSAQRRAPSPAACGST